uniref:Uncharacterized protein n=1 Tax=Fusarium oxysporum (strain Fo5176) TaxID=660025 RepID=A0A0D2Y1T7_FUSOF
MLPKQFLGLSFILVGSWAQKAPETVEPDMTEAPSSTTNTATTTTITTHTINVGAAGHKFTPNDIKADVGDILEYRFYPDAHWVIRGDFDNPCIPYDSTNSARLPDSGRGGFNEAYHKAFSNNAMPSNLNGTLPVVEAGVDSPNSTAPGYWVYKPMSPIASSSGQSHGTSPPITPSHNFPQDVTRMMSQDRSSLNTN